MRCVRRLHSLLNPSRRLSLEQNRIYVKAQPVLRGKTYATVGSRRWEKKNMRRFHYVLSIDDLSECWNARMLQLQVLGKERQKFLLLHRAVWCSEHGRSVRQSGNRAALRSISLPVSGVGGERHAGITCASIYQSLSITGFSSSALSTFGSVQMIFPFS